MKLSKLKLWNYRCFGSEEQVILIDQLTTFIGNNSAGKTAALSALNCMFSENSNDRILHRSATKNKNNNGVVVYPTKQPYEELDQVGYWCLLNVLKAKDFQEFLGNSEAFDFYCEYAKFDFSRFDVSWLLNLYPHTLEQIAKNAKVKERVRVAIATTLDGEAIAPSDSQRLQSILVKHFC